jgi:hypothetical protein
MLGTRFSLWDEKRVPGLPAAQDALEDLIFYIATKADERRLHVDETERG